MSQLRIGNYLYNPSEVLGKGSTGTVYLGIDTRANIPVAIKVIDLNNITNQVTQYLLQNETKALQLCNHPNVLKAYDVIYDDNNCYVITNYCPNNTLENLIKVKGRISEKEALKIFKEIINGYLNLSANKILHRDLKPSNVLFNENYMPVICDFGYCQIIGYKKKPKLQYNVGSPAYMAPQSITKNDYSQRSEIWSLGTILYEMLEGKSFAYGRDVMQAIMDIKKKGPYEPSSCSEFSKGVIRECMALFPNQRIKLKDLVDTLRTGEIIKRNISSSHESLVNTSILSNKISMNNSMKNIIQQQQHQRIVQSVPSQVFHQKLDTLQQIQQQQQMILPFPPQQLHNQQVRNSIQMPSTNFTTRGDTQVTRSTLPITSLPPKVFSNQPVRLSTQPSSQRFQINEIYHGLSLNPSERKILIRNQTQPQQRPSTTRLPIQLSPIQPHNTTFTNIQNYSDTQTLLNTSFQSQQPIMINQSHDEILYHLPTNRLRGNNTIENINVNFMNNGNRQQSVRSLIVNLTSEKRVTSSFSQNQQQQREKTKMTKLMESHNQKMQAQKSIPFQISPHDKFNSFLQPISTDRYPTPSPNQPIYEQINQLNINPFLKPTRPPLFAPLFQNQLFNYHQPQQQHYQQQPLQGVVNMSKRFQMPFVPAPQQQVVPIQVNQMQNLVLVSTKR